MAIKVSIVVGIGLLVAMIGMVDVGLIVADPNTLVTLGDVLNETPLQICLFGILLVASLLYHDVKSSMLIGIGVLTLIDWIMNSSWPSGVVHVPRGVGDYWENPFLEHSP